MFKKIFLGFIGVIFLLVVIGTVLGGGEEVPVNDSSQTQVTTDSEPEPSSAAIPEKEEKDNYLKAGMYKVGKDISAGEYLVIPTGGMAYYQVSSDSTGSLDSIIANDNFSGTRYVTVSDGQYFELRTSKMLLASEADPQTATNGEYLPGMYKVGKDIAPGEYKVVSLGGTAYIEVSNDSTGNLDSISTNDIFETEKYITIKSGQYIKLNNCKLIE